MVDGGAALAVDVRRLVKAFGVTPALVGVPLSFRRPGGAGDGGEAALDRRLAADEIGPEDGRWRASGRLRGVAVGHR